MEDGKTMGDREAMVDVDISVTQTPIDKKRSLVSVATTLEELPKDSVLGKRSKHGKSLQSLMQVENHTQIVEKALHELLGPPPMPSVLKHVEGQIVEGAKGSMAKKHP
jgi:hypothetical protein